MSVEAEFERHSFVVKIWIEDVKDVSGRIKWRGHVTHVASEKRRYVARLQDITNFIGGYLLEMGAACDEPGERSES